MPTYDTQATVNAAWGEPLTYTLAGSGTTYNVTGTRHLKGTAEGITSFGEYTIARELFTIAVDAIPLAPRLRDTLTPSGLGARVITSVSGSPWLKFWTLEAQYPSLAGILDQMADVLRATNTPTDEGFRSPSFTEAYDDVPCRLQPDSRQREWDTAGGVKTRSRFVCVFGSAVTLNAGDVIDVNGVKYEVTEQSEIESLGLLTFAACERID